MNPAVEQTAIVIGFDRASIHRLRKASLIAGITLTIVGLSGIILPQFLSLVSEIFLGWLMVLAGTVSLYIVFLSHGRSMISWLKALLLLATGAFLLFYPMSGVAAMALLLSFYLLLDAIGSFGLAHDYYPIDGWGWMVVNGIFSRCWLCSS